MMDKINIVIYTDERYYDDAIAIFEHINKFKNVNKLYYFTLDFYLYDVTNFEHEKLLPIRIDFDKKYDNFYQVKPLVMKESLRLPGENFLYIDTDLLLSSKFEDFLFEESEFPLSPWHFWERVHIMINNERFDDDALLKYLNVENRTMYYVQACAIAYNRKHKDFIEEIDMLCSNPTLNENRMHYLLAYDESAYNALLWKNQVTKNLGPVCMCKDYTNYSWEELIEKVEKNDEILFVNENRPFTNYFYTENVLFYHGIKGADLLRKLQKIIK